MTDRSFKTLLYGPVALLLLAGLLVILYGMTPQVIRVSPESWFYGKEMIAGRYIEGLIAQGQHALGGQRSFLAGTRFTRGQWWYIPLALLFKTPPLWLVAILTASFLTLFRKRSFDLDLEYL